MFVVAANPMYCSHRVLRAMAGSCLARSTRYQNLEVSVLKFNDALHTKSTCFSSFSAPFDDVVDVRHGLCYRERRVLQRSNPSAPSTSNAPLLFQQAINNMDMQMLTDGNAALMPKTKFCTGTRGGSRRLLSSSRFRFLDPRKYSSRDS